MKFSFFLPTKVNFGFGSLAGLPDEVGALGAKKALVVTDKVMVKTGIAEKTVTSLGIEHELFDAVEPEPKLEVAQAVAESARSSNFDLVVGVGGGSSIDMAKLAAAFAANDGRPEDFVGNAMFTKRGLPTIMVPTTAGTGAELTVTSMVTVGGHKQWINSPLLLPTVAMVDPELTMTMPKSVTAATGLDALSHNAEAYLSKASNTITDSAALEGISLISRNLERAYVDGNDRAAREAMSLGALHGGIALQGRMVYGHSIGYTIATRFILAHGVSCGIPLPYVISSCAVACASKMKKLAEAFDIRAEGDHPDEIGIAIGNRVKELVGKLGIPTSLKELGVRKEDLGSLAKECVQLYKRPNSPVDFDEGSMGGLYHMMWEGRLQVTPTG